MPDTSTGLSHLSDTLLVVAVLLYSAAMLGFAADLAFGRRRAAGATTTSPLAATSAAGTAAAAGRGNRESALVGVSVGHGSAESGRPEPAPAPGMAGAQAGGATATSGPPPAAGAGTGPGRGMRRRLDELAGGGEATGRLGRVALALTMLGWLAHVGAVTARGFAASRVPWGNMYEFSCMAALVAVTVFLVLAVRQRLTYLGVFVMLPVVLYLGLAGTVLYVGPGPLVPALNSYWLKIHVVAAITATGAFMVSGVVTCLQLARRRYDSVPAAGRPVATAGLIRRLPSADALDRTAFRIIGFAFPVWTFAVVAGAIWAEAAWGRYWGWDPKETWSFITWLIYAAYLHARSTAGGWRRNAAWLSLLGFAALIFNYYVVNTLIVGFHSYAGLK